MWKKWKQCAIWRRLRATTSAAEHESEHEPDHERMRRDIDEFVSSWFENGRGVLDPPLVSDDPRLALVEETLWNRLESVETFLQYHVDLIQYVFELGGLKSAPITHDYASCLKKKLKSASLDTLTECDTDNASPYPYPPPDDGIDSTSVVPRGLSHVAYTQWTHTNVSFDADAVLRIASTLSPFETTHWNVAVCMMYRCNTTICFRSYPNEILCGFVDMLVNGRCACDVIPFLLEFVLYAWIVFRIVCPLRLPRSFQPCIEGIRDTRPLLRHTNVQLY